MSDISSFRNKNPSIQSKFISQLEQEFTTIVRLLYSSSVPRPALESQILPYIAKNIHFKDPLQEGNGKELYRDSIKGFHNLFYFTHDTFQLQIKLNNDGRTGRCIVDGIINIRQFSWLYTYPLRAMFVFEFRLLSNPTTDKPQFEIFRHEEMWSICDMIDAVPGIGWCYKNLVRRGFTYLFAGISRLSCLLHDNLVQVIKKKE